jgi:hypothetical protein
VREDHPLALLRNQLLSAQDGVFDTGEELDAFLDHPFLRRLGKAVTFPSAPAQTAGAALPVAPAMCRKLLAGQVEWVSGDELLVGGWRGRCDMRCDLFL